MLSLATLALVLRRYRVGGVLAVCGALPALAVSLMAPFPDEVVLCRGCCSACASDSARLETHSSFCSRPSFGSCGQACSFGWLRRGAERERFFALLPVDDGRAISALSSPRTCRASTPALR